MLHHETSVLWSVDGGGHWASKQKAVERQEGFRGEELPAYDPRLPLTHTE